MTLDELFSDSGYKQLISCSKCGKPLKYLGIGEYQCEECGFIEYDDYGKVRCYLEKFPGANVVQVERATGVPQKEIRRMVKDEKFEVKQGSLSFLRCEYCGKPIRSGRFCEACKSSGNTKPVSPISKESKIGMSPKGESKK